MTTFSDLGLDAALLKALATENYVTPTPIQAKAIPHVLAGKDLLGVAQTGTGKTAAFALPILHRLAAAPRPAPRKGCRALVLSPTRELASQIAESFEAYGRHLGMNVTVIFGGVKIGKQIRDMMNGMDVVVATPGRLLDLVNQRAVTLSEVETIVLDEADQMLDMGFIHDIKKLVAMLPKKRQSLFFSATMPPAIAELADRFLSDPVKVAVTPVATTAERIDQSVIFVETARKQALLTKLLDDKSIERALVFTRTKHGADRVVRRLAASGIPAGAIHGNKSQPQRERALADFREGRARLLVATDIAARGIDVDGVSHVINFDLPNVPESYVHRIGRTARAGAAGVAISFCDGEERAYLRDIERLTRLKVPVVALPADLPVVPDAPRQDSRPQQPQRQPGRGAPRPERGQDQQQQRRNGAQQGRPRRDARPDTSAFEVARTDRNPGGRMRQGGPSAPRADAGQGQRQDRPNGQQRQDRPAQGRGQAEGARRDDRRGQGGRPARKGGAPRAWTN
ncbi:DEAD/DEAH box helicase [uncultured Alsobacter sp.]|uniref:DEAD/DEAH box helicase n=1 Tax=uncultured Alsobacter sp. TaxID=1748258 RepID=UPI0025DA0732|nr:DEAD/DEAH box helicase [uncultured Alsobacter sp.]